MFRKQFFSAAVAALVPLVGSAQPTPDTREFRIDAGHSVVEFSVPFLGYAVRGRFDDVKGSLFYAPTASGEPGSSRVALSIPLSGLSTGSKHRDEHLRSEDFFNADSFPTITFRSTTIVRRDTAFVMRGTLVMHGVSREVAIPFTAGPLVEDPHGSTLLHFAGRLRLARKDYGIAGGSKNNDWFDSLRSSTMGDSVDVTLEVAAWRSRAR